MPKGRLTRRASTRMTYDERLELFYSIVQVAEDVLKNAKGLSARERRERIASGNEYRTLAPTPPRTMGGIKQLQSDFLVEWNESVGPHVEDFWQRIKERGIPIERRDVVKDVLERKRIKNRHEYETIVDSIVVLQQIGKITAAEAQALDRMLADFEKRASR